MNACSKPQALSTFPGHVACQMALNLCRSVGEAFCHIDLHVLLKEQVLVNRLHWLGRINQLHIEPPEELIPSVSQEPVNPVIMETRTSTKTLLSSMKATAFPLHPHLPEPKTRSTCCRHRIRSASATSSQRSGLNKSASFPKMAVNLCTERALWPIRVPPGINWP